MLETVKPMDIEKRSFEIITEILGDKKLDSENELVIKRVIHTSADFDYADTLEFSKDAVKIGIEAIKSGCGIITDTKMAQAGINKKALAMFNTRVECFIDDERVVKAALERGVTRSAVSMEIASEDANNKIFAIGNAPTALISLHDLIKTGKSKPELVIGVPVGFVNVCEAKEMFKTVGIPYIISNGRKGGSNIAAAIVNAMIYMIKGTR